MEERMEVRITKLANLLRKYRMEGSFFYQNLHWTNRMKLRNRHSKRTEEDKKQVLEGHVHLEGEKSFHAHHRHEVIQFGQPHHDMRKITKSLNKCYQLNKTKMINSFILHLVIIKIVIITLPLNIEPQSPSFSSKWQMSSYKTQRSLSYPK